MTDSVAARPADGRHGLVGDSGRIAVAAALSRVTGLARVVVAASVLGSTVLGDLFIAVNVLPLMLYDVVAGSAISSILVPPLVRLLERGAELRARIFAGNALGLICAAMAAVVAVALVGRGLLASALTWGVDELLADEAVRVAGLLLLLIVPQLIVYAAIGVLVSIQHAHQRFLLPSAAPVVENVGLIVTVVVAGARYGSGLDVDGAPLGLIVTLGVGSGLSVLAHALVQLVGAWRAAGSITIGLDRHDRAIRDLAGPLGDSFGWSSVIALRQFALVVAAGFAGAGGVQAFELATLAYFVPVALVGRPIASAALPRLSRTGHDATAVLVGYRTAIRLAAWLAVPAGLALVVVSGPLADVVARGEFDTPDATRMMGYALAGLGLGAASEALFEVARQTTMARGQRAGLRRSTWVRAVTAAVGLPLAVVVVDGPALLLALGLVVSIGDGVALVVAHRHLRADPAWPSDSRGYGFRIALASVLALTPVAVIGPRLPLDGDLIRLGAVALGVAALYPIAVYLASDRGRLVRALATGPLGEGSR